MYAGACVCGCVCMVYISALRIVSADKILHFINTLIIRSNGKSGSVLSIVKVLTIEEESSSHW